MQSRDTDYVVLENATFRGPARPIFVNTNFRLPAAELPPTLDHVLELEGGRVVRSVMSIT